MIDPQAQLALPRVDHRAFPFDKGAGPGDVDIRQVVQVEVRIHRIGDGDVVGGVGMIDPGPQFAAHGGKGEGGRQGAGLGIGEGLAPLHWRSRRRAQRDIIHAMTDIAPSGGQVQADRVEGAAIGNPCGVGVDEADIH